MKKHLMSRVPPGLALGLLLALVATASLAAQNPLTEAPSEAPGERFEVTVFNVSPLTAVTIDLPGVRLLGVAPRLGSDRFAAGVSLASGRIVFRPPAGAVADGTLATVTFAVWMEVSGPLQGTVSLTRPEVVLVETTRGKATLQEGAFRIDTPSLPSNCVLAGCNEGYASCPRDDRGTERKCHQFLGDWLCCVGSPIPIL